LRVYADTSFLVSLYCADGNSAAAIARMGQLRGEFLLTPLAELELVNALQLRVFRKETSVEAAQAGLRDFEEDLRDGMYLPQAMPLDVYNRARQISARQAASLGTRTLDILHVASALQLKADRFWTFDQRQAALASAEGLRA
jgi:predicted nucleic acid-binding protein